MTRPRKILLVIALALAAAGIGALVIEVTRKEAPGPPAPLVLEGSALRQDSDPAKRTPLSGVTVTAVDGSGSVSGKTNALGFFSLTLTPGVRQGEPVDLTFKEPGYKTLEITATKPGDQLYIEALQPLQPGSGVMPKSAGGTGKVIGIRNVRVRYTSKDQSTIGVGSLAKQFPAPNNGNIPCNGQRPCSPDGKWRATKTILPLDAGEGNEFSNVRVSCVAGPCAFTKVQPERFGQPERKISISVLNWSETTDFLIEADVERTMITDEIQYSYPFIVGQTMNFSLPPSSEGPSVEADLDGHYIVFPLGPDVILSVAACSVEISADGNRIYRCQLKPGYEFKD